MAHQKLYVKGDAKFNESYASFVEAIGVERWLEQRNAGEALENWRTLGEARSAFNRLVDQSRAELAEIYASNAASAAMREDKQAAFERLQTRYRRVREEQWNGRDYFGGWFERELNNARFALFDSYEGGHCAFDRLYDEAGEDIERFHELARARSELPADERQKWLSQSCDEIAPTTEL
jgi:predicted aminopeptidase